MLVPEPKRKKTIGVKEIEATVASMARIPAKSVSKDDTEVLQHLEQTLKRAVYGHDRGGGGVGLGHQARSGGPPRSGKAHRLLPVLRPDRRWQDGGGPPALGEVSGWS